MALSESLPGSLGPSPAHSIQENRKEKKQTESEKNTSAIKIKRLSGFTTCLKFISLLCLEFVCLSVCVLLRCASNTILFPLQVCLCSPLQRKVF